jgi:hypothetical protein
MKQVGEWFIMGPEEILAHLGGWPKIWREFCLRPDVRRLDPAQRTIKWTYQQQKVREYVNMMSGFLLQFGKPGEILVGELHHGR